MLHPIDMMDVSDSSGKGSRISVLHPLHLKHPDYVIPLKSALIPCSDLPVLEHIEITGTHIIWVAHSIQGEAAPRSCDVIHWHDSLLRFSAHSDILCESVAILCCRWANSIIPWDNVRSLLSIHLIALDKSQGVRPIGLVEN